MTEGLGKITQSYESFQIVIMLQMQRYEQTDYEVWSRDPTSYDLAAAGLGRRTKQPVPGAPLDVY